MMSKPQNRSWKEESRLSSADDHGSKQHSFGWKCLQLSSSTLCGIIFGFCVEKGRVFEPQVIRDQMTFDRFIMLKMFLSASATSMFSFSLLTMLPPTRPYMAQATRAFTAGFDTKGLTSSIVGGAILGCGMTLSGGCPGMLMAQVGAGVDGAAMTLFGALSGVLLYGLVEPTVVGITKPASPIRRHFVQQHIGGPFFVLALPCAAVLGMTVCAVELCAPWTSEVPVRGGGILTSLSWPPYVAGMLIGLLQIPIVLFTTDTLGSSTSYCSILSQIFRVSALRNVSPYLNRYSSGIGNWWQVFYVGGAVMGAYLSASLSATVGSTSGVSPMAAFFGGALLLFGSRLAAGCTSGHGLSGMGLLASLSLVAVPAMFAGGVASAMLMKAL